VAAVLAATVLGSSSPDVVGSAASCELPDSTLTGPSTVATSDPAAADDTSSAAAGGDKITGGTIETGAGVIGGAPITTGGGRITGGTGTESADLPPDLRVPPAK